MADVFHQPKGPCYPDLQGKIALVTGGGSGIGRGICMRLAAEGMRIYLCGRTRETLDETAARISAAGGLAVPIACDVTRKRKPRRVRLKLLHGW